MNKNLIRKIDNALEELELLAKEKDSFLPRVGFLNMIQSLKDIKEQIENNKYRHTNYGISYIVLDSWPYDEDITEKLLIIEKQYKVLQKHFFEKQQNNNSQSVKM